MKKISCILTVFAILTAFGSCQRSEYTYRQESGMVWNTTYHITYNADRMLGDSAIAVLERVELSVSAFNPQSLVSRINTNTGDSVDTDFVTVYSTARRINELSDRAFDPTLAPLINLYGFGFEKIPQADTTRVAEILQYVGIEKTSLNGNKLVKQDARTQFNFSALAKGYGCDKVGEMLYGNGVNDYMVEIGGEINMRGNNPNGRPWRISIDRPVFSNDSIVHDSQMVVELTDCGMATSGNYRNFKMIDGKRVVHTIDRHTGRPALNDLLSASIIIFNRECGKSDVLCDENPCMLADAFATACMSMGSEKAKRLIESNKIAALLILSDGTTWQSSAFKRYVKAQ